jgi:hypothetical protein
MIELKAPNKTRLRGPSVFLGGTIDMGNSEDWQKFIVESLTKLDWDGIIYNPRRDDWDSSWEQTLENKNFAEQLSWENDHQKLAGLNVYYFAPGSKSPITLMELGEFGKYETSFEDRPNDVVVCCPEGYWRKGNVDFFCMKYQIRQVASLDLLALCINGHRF